MPTLVVSDLHLGARTRVDLLRHEPAALEALVGALDGIDRLVLLGDVLELRHGPVREGLAAAREPLTTVAEAMRGAEIVLAAGNHDHRLVGGWLERQGRDARPALDLEHRVASRDASWPASQIGEWLRDAGASVEVAYPGLWLRDDVYAMHGHYLDLHSSVPNFERLAASATARLTGPLPAGPVRPDDYEARLAPVYAWIDQVAEWAPGGRAAGGAGSAVRAWRVLSGQGRRSLRARALAAGFPLAVAGLNRAGLGPLNADVSGPAMRRATLAAMAQVVDGLGVRARHVVFGHSHRTGPLPGDDLSEWRTPNGAQLHNTGSWVLETHFLGGPDARGPYWPGGAIRVDDDDSPPRLLRLLEGEDLLSRAR